MSFNRLCLSTADPYHSIDSVYLHQILMSFNRLCLSTTDPYHSIDSVYLQKILMSFNRLCLSVTDLYVTYIQLISAAEEAYFLQHTLFCMARYKKG